MEDVKSILVNIGSIQEAVDTAHFNVYSNINDFAEKVGIMEQCGLNIMSEDQLTQHIIDNREQIQFDFRYFDESKKETNKVWWKTLLGGLIGAAAGMAVVVPLVTLAPITLADFFFCSALLSISTLGGEVIAEKIADAKRAKGIKGELMRDIEAVSRELAKNTGTIDDDDIKSLRNKSNILLETIIAASNAKNEDVDYELKKKLGVMRPTVKALASDITIYDTDTNKKIFEDYAKASDAVIRLIAGITDEEAKKLAEKMKPEVAEIQEAFNDAIANGEFIVESKKPRRRVIGKTVLGGFLGGLATLPIRLIIAGGFAFSAAAAVAAGGSVGASAIPMIRIGNTVIKWSGRLVGGAIANKINKAKRDKGIKGEILKDIQDVMKELGKPADAGRYANYDDLRKALKTLRESLKFGIKRQQFGDMTQAANALLNATEALNSGFENGGSENKKRLMTDFLTAADEMVGKITGVTETEAKKALEELKENEPNVEKDIQESFFGADIVGEYLAESAKATKQSSEIDESEQTSNTDTKSVFDEIAALC